MTFGLERLFIKRRNTTRQGGLSCALARIIFFPDLFLFGNSTMVLREREVRNAVPP